MTEYHDRDAAGHYKSLTDVTKTPIFNEDIDYNNHVCIEEQIRLLMFINCLGI